jgi:putative ABC transport system permease protein
MSSAEANFDPMIVMSDSDIVSRLSTISKRPDVSSFTPSKVEARVHAQLASGGDIGFLVAEFADDVPVEQGQPFSQTSGNVAIMYRNQEFANIKIGARILVDGEVFTVIGLTDSLGTGGSTRLYFPLRLEGHVHIHEESVAAAYTLRVANGVDLMSVCQSALRQLNTGIDPNLKFIDMNAELSSMLQQSLLSVQVVLALIASVSLAVAALNILNTMYIATLERADEIAIFKSLGMTRARVVLLFIFESVVVVALFAAMGCLLGNLGALVILSLVGMPMVFSWPSVVVLLPVTILVGLGGGFYPAYRAAKIDPVRLLR